MDGNREPWWVNETQEQHDAGMEALFLKELGDTGDKIGLGLYATNTEFTEEDYDIDKLLDVMKSMRAPVKKIIPVERLLAMPREESRYMLGPSGLVIGNPATKEERLLLDSESYRKLRDDPSCADALFNSMTSLNYLDETQFSDPFKLETPLFPESPQEPKQ